MAPFSVRIIDGVPGSRKSLSQLDAIAARPRDVVWASARQQLLDEHAAYCREVSSRRAMSLAVEVIHSGQSVRGTVKRRVETALKAENPNVPRVVMITHEALMALDPADLAGWEVVIDEVPDGCVASGSVSAQASWIGLDQRYSLEPVGIENWHQVRLRGGVEPLQRSAIAQDTASDLAALHKCVHTPGRAVYVDLAAWQDAQALGRKIAWWSVWTPLSLSGTAGVTVIGAGFFQSTAYLVAKALHPDAIRFDRIGPANPVLRKQQTFRIHYFTRHRGSTTWWATDEGSRCLVQLSRHLEDNGFAAFFSCNADILPYFRHRFKAAFCNPKQAGTNRLIDHTACAYIYSNKAQDADKPILQMFDLNASQILQAREYEDIIQFVMRGAPRNPHYEGPYDVYLYSQDQAEMLMRYLIKHGIAAAVELIPVLEAGIMDVQTPASDRSKEGAVDPLGHQERIDQRRRADALRQKRRRAERVAQQKADGTHRRAGRPLKAG